MMNSLSPNLFVENVNQTIKCYTKLGFKLSMSVPESGEFDWAMMTNGTVSFMFQTFKSLGEELPEVRLERTGGTLIFYIQMNGIRDFYEKIKNDFEILKDLNKTFYGATEFTIKDCDGYVLTFAEDEE